MRTEIGCTFAAQERQHNKSKDSKFYISKYSEVLIYIIFSTRIQSQK